MPVFKCCTVLNKMSELFVKVLNCSFSRNNINRHVNNYRLNSLEVEEEEVNVSDSPNTGQRSDTSMDKKKS